MGKKFTTKQRKARNEAFHLLFIARRILGNDNLVGYPGAIKVVLDIMERDAKLDRDAAIGRAMDFVK